MSDLDEAWAWAIKETLTRMAEDDLSVQESAEVAAQELMCTMARSVYPSSWLEFDHEAKRIVCHSYGASDAQGLRFGELFGVAGEDLFAQLWYAIYTDTVNNLVAICRPQ